MWIDTHAHLDKLNIPIKQALEEAKKSSVNHVVTIGTERKDWENVIQICESYQPQVYGTLGMHPHTADHFDEECEDFLNKNLDHKRIIAVGEIGLDYHYEHSKREKQKEVFEKQLNLAKKFKLPVEIHTREAEEDTLFFLKKFQGEVRGLLHCFTSSYKMAAAALDLGFNISFSGVITFKNSEDLRKTCKKIPLDRLHIETDSPFLSPVPYRGKENQPSRVSHVAETVASLHQVNLDVLSNQLMENTLNLFPKIKREELLCLN